MSFAVGDVVCTLNLKYKDGTRLRETADDESKFNGVWVDNDVSVEVEDVRTGFVLIKKQDGSSGWIRERNLTKEQRKSGIVSGVISNQIVTPDPEYCMGKKLYGVGIKQDPIPGEKMGKGIQHLTSAIWVTDIAAFIARHFNALQEYLRHAKRGSDEYPGYDFIYLTNMSNYLFNKADVQGIKSQDSKDFFLMATWLIMAAAEVDTFPFGKYKYVIYYFIIILNSDEIFSIEEKAKQREEFYDRYFNPTKGPGVVDAGNPNGDLLGKFAGPFIRVDLIPMKAMERLEN